MHIYKGKTNRYRQIYLNNIKVCDMDEIAFDQFIVMKLYYENSKQFIPPNIYHSFH